MLFEVPVNRKAGSGFGSLGDHITEIGVESRFDLISSLVRSGFLWLRLFKQSALPLDSFVIIS